MQDNNNHPPNSFTGDSMEGLNMNWLHIKADFDVELLATSGGASLFGALRKGGNQRTSTPLGPWISHVMGAWHFVSVTASSKSMQSMYMQQWHIPRFEMAWALRQQDHGHTSAKYETPVSATWMPISSLFYRRHQISFLIDGFGEFQLPVSFVRKMEEDLAIVESAMGRVNERGGKFFLPRAKTAAGHSVESSAQELLAAIAFEKLTAPRMNAGNFGIYSAYCTYRDFDLSVSMPYNVLCEMVEAQMDYEAGSVSADIYNMFDEVQTRLLDEPIWGKDVRVNLDEAVTTLAAGLDKLNRTQRTQFILLNGMHGAGIFLPLATIVGICPFGQYADYICRNMAPDSPEEQERRIETAYIRLFGELARD